MGINFNLLRKQLESDDVSWFAKNVNVGKDTGSVSCLLIPYKNSRVDMERLDEVCGPENWQNKFKRDRSGILQCAVGIKSENEWVWKSSNGVPSKFEKEKGEYSDAFKRACVMWGIGRELYDLPNVWVNLKGNEYYQTEGGVKVDKSFDPNDWIWDIDWEYKGQHGAVGRILAKENASDNGYRVKKAIYLGPNHT